MLSLIERSFRPPARARTSSLHHEQRQHPRDDLSVPLRGVFSTRSADRPNPVGVHRVTIVEVAAPTRMRVHALEAIDGTPIVDLKPTLDRQAER